MPLVSAHLLIIAASLLVLFASSAVTSENLSPTTKKVSNVECMPEWGDISGGATWSLTLLSSCIDGNNTVFFQFNSTANGWPCAGANVNLGWLSNNNANWMFAFANSVNNGNWVVNAPAGASGIGAQNLHNFCGVSYTLSQCC